MAEESDGGTPCVEVLLEESSFLCSRLDDIIDVPEELVDKAVKLALGQVCSNPDHLLEVLYYTHKEQ